MMSITIQETEGKNEIPTQVDEFIRDEIVNESKSSIVIGFVTPNGTSIFGYGSVSEANNMPVNETTLFRIGSITKTFTTVLLADVVNQGMVKLDDPIDKYLPANVTVPEFQGQKITLEDLATHTSGLPEFPSNIWLNNTFGDMNSNYATEQFYQALSNFTLTREPGSQLQYSSFGTGLLGHILSVKAGVSYEELVEDRILNVLGMNDTKFTLSENENKTRFPKGHQGGQEVATPILPKDMVGSGALISTGEDMLKYASANLGFIHTELDDAMQLAHLIRHPGATANPMNYSEYVGLGWRIATDYGKEIFTHSGAINGWNAFVGFIPSEQIGVVALCSCDNLDADMNNVGYVLLGLTGPETLALNTEQKFHTSNVDLDLKD